MRGFYPEERVDGGLWKKGGVLFKAAKRVERDLFGMADGIVTLTEASLPILSTRIAAAGGRAVPRVIPTCVDLDRFKPVPTGTRPEEFTLAYFGSLGTWYRLGDMLRFGRYVLEAAGGGRLLFLTNDDPSPVQRLAAEAGMPPEVLSVGSVPHEDVPAALAGAHATFFLIRSGPSRFGFHQTKLGESLALGLPVADPSTPERCRGVAEREYDRALGVRRYAALYRDLMDISPGRRITRLAAMVTLPTMASCKGVVSRSMVLSFLEAVQRPFDLHDQTWLGIPAALPAHLIVSALLAGALTWLWRPKAAGILILILILAKEAVDLMIIALYEPLTWAYASGSVADVVASIAGAGLGLWVGTRARRR